MSDKRIKGITLEFGSDTTGLEKALSDVNKQSSKLQSELKDVERLLKFDPGNVEALAQKQKLLSDQVVVTTDKLSKLQQAEQQVQSQFEKGKISEEQYRAFRREIEFTEKSLESLNGKLSYLKEEQQKVGTSTKQLETFFHATGTSVTDFSDVLGNRLTNAILKGTATSKQLEDAIQKIGHEALGANVDIDKMKQALSSLDDGASLKSVKKELGSLSKEASDAKQSVSELGGALEGIAGTLVAGGGIAGTIQQALDTSSLKTKIDVSFDVPEKSKESIKLAVKEIEAYGVDGEAALEGVRRQWALNKTASDEANASIVKSAATLTQSYAGLDFTEVIQEINEIASELKMSNEEAAGLANALLKAGFPPEQFDTIAEYGQQLQRVGFDAGEVQAIMMAGVDTKTWNIDNLLDGLKEGRVKVAEFGQGLTEAQMIAFRAADISGKQVIAWSDAVAKGGKDGSQAMNEIAVALNGIKDETVKNTLGVQIFGTMYEDQGQNIIDTLINAKNTTVDLKKGQEDLNNMTDKYSADPAIKMKKAVTELKTSLEPLLKVVAEVISNVAEWISKNPKLAATITAIVTGLGILIGIIMAMTPVILALSAAAGALNIAMLPLTGIILGIMAAIAAVIAIGVLLYKNWDTIKKKASELVKSIKNKFNEFKEIDLLEVGKNIVGGLIKGIGSMAGSIKEKVIELAQSLPNWMKKVLDIHSPSKVTEEIGQFVSQGLAKGIEKDSKKPVASAKKVASDTKKSFENEFKNIDLRLDAKKINVQEAINELEKLKIKYKSLPNAVAKVNKEIYTLNKEHAKMVFENEVKSIKDKADLNKISIAQELKLWQDLQKQYASGSKERIEIDKEVHRVKGELLKQQFDNEKSIVDKKKYYNQLSLTEELSAYQEYISKYKKGSEEREYYEREIYRVKQEINNKLISINEEYANKITETNNRLIAEEKRLTDEYNQAVESRTKSLYSFSGLFDEVQKKSDISGKQLIENLKSQVDTFTNWANTLQELAAKGIDEGLLEELRAMGPSAAAEIAALNTLSASELELYVQLWKDKNALARTEAIKELEEMKLDTQSKITELRVQTQADLDLYKAEWITKVQEIRTGAIGELDPLRSSLKGIGLQSIQGLIEGMQEMVGPLMEQARSIADAVSSTIKEALDIHSPSRLMRDEVGKMIPLGVAEGIKENIKAVINASNQMAKATIPSTTSHNVNNSRTYQPSITVYGGSSAKDIAIENERMFRRLAFEFN
ncbi:hypothetical protein ACFSO7_02945 [Bacillus sp. CGMCC 1.16607]|uniref:hypothetical protein n=1 Tax=Bacillus sp. CGMCC 1.16607 TaxID=3351842 RepID=UPI00363267CA